MKIKDHYRVTKNFSNTVTKSVLNTCKMQSKFNAQGLKNASDNVL